MLPGGLPHQLLSGTGRLGVFTLVEVTATFDDPDEDSSLGQITATLTETMHNGGQEVVREPIVGHLSSEGELLAADEGPFQLAATDDAGTKTLSGKEAEYEWTIQLGNAPLHTFTAPLAHATNPVDIVELEEL